MKLLFIGDIFAKAGRQIIAQQLPQLQRQHGIDLTIANGENAAGGFGITPELTEDLLGLGIDCLTSGNHIWNKNEIKDYLRQTAASPRLLRPYNMHASAPGTGLTILTERLHKPVAVINLIGRVFLGNYDCPFAAAKEAVAKARKQTNLILVDFHAETTSEKRAMGWYLTGSVSAVVGTHTHIQTADESILPGGTGYITDVGMTGPHDSVIGVEKQEIIDKFITQLPTRFNAANAGAELNAVVLELDDASGQCRHIERVKVKNHESSSRASG